MDNKISITYSDYRRYNVNKTSLFQIARKVISELGEIQGETNRKIIATPHLGDESGYSNKITLNFNSGSVEYYYTTQILEVTLPYLNNMEKIGKQFFHGIEKHLNGHHTRHYPEKKYCEKKAKNRWRVQIV